MMQNDSGAGAGRRSSGASGKRGGGSARPPSTGAPGKPGSGKPAAGSPGSTANRGGGRPPGKSGSGQSRYSNPKPTQGRPGTATGGSDASRGEVGRGPGSGPARSDRSGRRDSGSRGARPQDPPIPEGVQTSDLDRVTLNTLRTLPDGLAETVALHLAAAARLLSDDPQVALAHAKAAARRAGRVAITREAVGVAAYSAGDFGTALTELKAAARISGSSEYLPMIADCERGLDRPERALSLASSPEAATLDREGKVELLLVAAGARRDLGQVEAAVLTLQVPALNSRGPGQWLARLRYAYADALLAAGRSDEARQWFSRAAQVDPEGETDAAERVDELDGLTFEEIDDSDAGDSAQGPQGDDARPGKALRREPGPGRPAGLEAP